MLVSLEIAMNAVFGTYYLSAYLSASAKCRQDVNRLLISAAANSFYEFPIL